jgi:hypothetical protein
MALGKKTGGRKKGTPNKRTEGVKEVLDNLGCDPIRNLAKASEKAESDEDWNLFYNVNKELAKYCYSQRKAIEVNDEGEKETRTIEVRIVGNEGSQVLSTSTSSIEV